MKWQIIRAEIFWVYFCHYSLWSTRSIWGLVYRVWEGNRRRVRASWRSWISNSLPSAPRRFVVILRGAFFTPEENKRYTHWMRAPMHLMRARMYVLSFTTSTKNKSNKR
jgi:hypothetical protein